MKRALTVKLALTAAMLCPASTALPATNMTVAARELAPPAAPREFFNAGTRELRAGKLREAEALLESALSSQNERLQTPALYNLGHVRFSQGVEELKKGPSAASTAARSQLASAEGEAEIQAIDNALASNEVEKLVPPYLHGRVKRR